ncbi:MAG: hypothetical protein KA369_19060 [Spirochaetes bacterium]|nr:hypothetical protein [Spirochaetota bacterium]
MEQVVNIGDVMENTREEILFAIKERIFAMTRGTSAPVQLHGLIIRDKVGSGRDSLFFYEITNVFVDDDDRLCGDLASSDDRLCEGILFGKDIEDLPSDDLKRVLDILYTDNCKIDIDNYNMSSAIRRVGLFGFLMDRRAGISRLMRRGA